ncbi:MAG: dTMP kinase [Candidatus Omnitrophota bacterium]
MKGLFITFEGIEGGGKSCQASMLESFLKKEGYDALVLREPGGTVLGEKIRKSLLTPGYDITQESEMLLYMAARAQIVSEVIIPALKKGTIVICDRFLDATVCYQGYGLGVDLKVINQLNKFVTKDIVPEITFFMDIDIQKGLERCKDAKGYKDRIEQRSIAFHKRVRQGYLKQAEAFPKRFKRIYVKDESKEDIQNIVRGIVFSVLKRSKVSGLCC